MKMTGPDALRERMDIIVYLKSEVNRDEVNGRKNEVNGGKRDETDEKGTDR